MNLEPLLTTSEVAKILGLSEKTVRKLKNHGLIPINFGGRFRYRKDDVDQFIKRSFSAEKELYCKSDKETIVMFPGLNKETKEHIKKKLMV
jgi:excisionase family DNA binding protein